jgi:peptidyl-prolyl cis-trans isomerase A (cyclophilin A)
VKPDGTGTSKVFSGAISGSSVSPDGRLVLFPLTGNPSERALKVVRTSDDSVVPFDVRIHVPNPDPRVWGRTRWRPDGGEKAAEQQADPRDVGGSSGPRPRGPPRSSSSSPRGEFPGRDTFSSMKRNLALALAAAFLLAATLKGETSVKNPSVVMKTSLGSITIELDAAKAPVSVANFLAYVNDKFYDGTVFHRVIDGFMIQGGGFKVDKVQKATKPPIKNEAANGLKNNNGTIAMARTSDMNSATAQFYINVNDNANLDGGYCVFGKVTAGMDVVNKIKATPKSNQGGAFVDAPVTPVVIESIRAVP